MTHVTNKQERECVCDAAGRACETCASVHTHTMEHELDPDGDTASLERTLFLLSCFVEFLKVHLKTQTE